MSDLYKTVNGKKVRKCKYECGQSVAWSDKGGYFVEVDNDNQHHTKERCLAFKEIHQDPDKKKAVETIKQIENTTNNNNNRNPILTVQQIIDRFKKIGIDIDLSTFLKETESNK